jgi:DNA-binding MarR family transcriptional regulator
MVQRLEKAGLIERRSDPHDARVSRVHPTARSRMIEPAVRHAWAQLDEVMIGVLGQNAERLQRLSTIAAAALD